MGSNASAKMPNAGRGRVVARARTQKWSYSVGERPDTVRVYERTPSGVLQVATWDRTIGEYRRKSLGHRDRQRAKEYANQLAALLARDGATDEP